MRQSKKILFISYDGLTDPLGQSQIIPYLAGLTEYGYEFTILSCDKKERYAKHKSYVLELLAPYKIKWVSLPYHKSPGVLSSAYDYHQLKRTAIKLHKKEKFDLVHTRPGVPTLVALHLKRKYDIKFLNDVRGFWADERVDGGMWDMKNPLFKKIYSFFKNHEYACILESDYTTCLTTRAKIEMQSWKQLAGKKIPMEVIPCSVDLRLFDPLNINPSVKESVRKQLGIEKEDIIVSYLGSIGGWYLTDEMMQFCKSLSDANPKIRFLFICPHRHEVIAAAASKFGIPPSKFIVREGKRHEVPTLLSFSNYSLFFIKSSYSKMSSSPTKHGEIMAMGIPVITNSGVGDVDSVIEKYNSGIVLSSLCNDEYKAVADSIFSFKFDPVAIRAAAKEFYGLDKAVEKYADVYSEVFAN